MASLRRKQGMIKKGTSGCICFFAYHQPKITP